MYNPVLGLQLYKDWFYNTLQSFHIQYVLLQLPESSHYRDLFKLCHFLLNTFFAEHIFVKYA